VPVVLIFLLFGLFFQTAPAEATLDATVNQVIDGMTLDAQVDGNRTAVGYLGVETPAPNQRCGREALARNLQLAATGHLLLAADAAYTFDDKHRKLFYAYTPDGISVEETLITEGLAIAVRTDAAHGPDLAALQADSQANAQGCLWSAA
jgi:endonuclease YncB( thermonuclease family)